MEYLLILMMALSSFVHSSSIDALTSEDDETDDDEPWEVPYLPNTIKPTYYDLFLFPNFYFNESVFSGNITIRFLVLQNTSTIIVHMKDLNITSTTVSNCYQQKLNVTRAFEYEENQYWVVQTERPLPVTSCIYYLKLEFSGNLAVASEEDSKSLFGFFKITYDNDITEKQSWLVATDFQPSNSRFAFPNFDEPRFKVVMRVVLRHWKNFTALSNMPESRHSDSDDIWRHTLFKQSPKMSSYLACFIISDFASKSNTLVDGKPHRVWARPDRLDKVDYALNVTPILDKYTYQEFDVANWTTPNRLDKLDQFALPQFVSDGGMENWGLVTYKDSTILFDVTQDGDIARQNALTLIAHEVQHNYFGNLVTCKYWNHVWLNEGLTTFYEIRTVTAFDPTLFYKEQHLSVKLELTMVMDAKSTTQPLAPVHSLPDEDYFSALTYDKGAAIIRMVENFVGAATFRRGIKRYLEDNAHKNVVTENLWNALDAENGSSPNLTKIMKEWVYDSGFPLITVELLPGNQINATQKRFLLDPKDVVYKECKWFVPLNYRTKGGEYDLVWMNKTDAVFDIPLNSDDDWVQFNYDFAGYYRVNYDAILWDRITKQLNDDHTVLSALARLKLLSDAVNLAEAEQLGYDTFLNLTRYASKERELAPWFHICDNFNVINEMVSDTANFSHYQRYVLNLTTSLMDELQVKDEGSYAEKLLRPKIMSMSCSAGHRGCAENTTRLFKAWIQNETMNAIPVNFRRDALCIGVANSLLESEWNTVFERYTVATFHKDSSDLLHALTCSRNVTLLERLLEYSTDETKMDIFDGFAAIDGIASNPASEGCVWKWLTLNNTNIDKKVKERFSSIMLRAAVQVFKTREKRQEVLDYLNNNSIRRKERYLRVIDRNIHWMDKHFATIVSWLEQNVPT